ncbi:prepilin peptidase [Sphingomonas sp.]|uniref:A24 family peptidase n=1 Tax=Sphingomonas sp. TaxID=28214 RepID=UPI001B0F9DDA|nr:prepilin peptidase [Sphingomonas sp.]MBO9711347.1 prepilin peptidase [Sphingomonas sp.]
MGNLIAFFLVGALALLLVSAGIQDARTREIANWKNGLIALMAPLWWVANGLHFWPDMALQFGVALLVFAFFAGAFAIGQMGGGDVKLIGALALWFPVVPLVWLLVVMSIAGGLLTLVMVIEKHLRKNPETPEIPYGVAIAIAGLIALREPLFNHFG